MIDAAVSWRCLDEEFRMELTLPMSSTKAQAHAAIETLPDDATLQDAADKLGAACRVREESGKRQNWPLETAG